MTSQVCPNRQSVGAPLPVTLYRAAKLCTRLSLSGRPPDPSFHAQLLMSNGSLEPPPLKVLAARSDVVVGLFAMQVGGVGCVALQSFDHATAVAPLVLLDVEQSKPATW